MEIDTPLSASDVFVYALTAHWLLFTCHVPTLYVLTRFLAPFRVLSFAISHFKPKLEQ